MLVYRRLTEQAGWPEFGAAAAGDASVETRLVVTVARESAGDHEAPIARTREGRGDEPPKDAGFLYSLWVVASHNLWRFEFKLPREEWTVEQATLSLRTTDPAITRIEVLLADGLDEYLEGEFEEALVNSYQRRLVWRAQDPVERGLAAARTGAEV